MKIANAQTQISQDVKINSKLIQEAIIQAASKGAKLVHFAEGALSGYVKSQIASWDETNWLELQTEIDKIKNLCSKENIWTVFGCNHKVKSLRPFNSLHVINDSGDLIARYDKRLCSNTEISDWYNAGKKPVTIEIEGIRFGLALCIEVNFPEIFMEYEKLGVNCVLLSSYSDSEVFSIQAQGHAACNNFWISYSVPENVSSHQASQIIGPDGKIITKCANGINDMIFAEINPNNPKWEIPCKKARPWRKKARNGNIYKELMPL